jgi:hypothetical protein
VCYKPGCHAEQGVERINSGYLLARLHNPGCVLIGQLGMHSQVAALCEKAVKDDATNIKATYHLAKVVNVLVCFMGRKANLKLEFGKH